MVPQSHPSIETFAKIPDFSPDRGTDRCISWVSVRSLASDPPPVFGVGSATALWRRIRHRGHTDRSHTDSSMMMSAPRQPIDAVIEAIVSRLLTRGEFDDLTYRQY
jgi:hypothetical protein